MSNYKIVLIDQRDCHYTAAYYETFHLASKNLERVMYDCFWKNNTIEIASAVIEPIKSF
jgi:hypothetical protein